MTKNDSQLKLIKMKNKTRLLFMLGLLSVIALVANASIKTKIPAQVECGDIPPNETIIVLHGDLEFNPEYNYIEAYADGDYVYIYFHQNFGYVNIIIMTEMGGTIYDNTINTAVQTTCIIPMSGFITGKYTLILNNANGYAEGDFIKQ